MDRENIICITIYEKMVIKFSCPVIRIVLWTFMLYVHSMPSQVNSLATCGYGYSLYGFCYFLLSDYFLSSDVALVTSLRDGMNLVSYEFVACQEAKKGVLILSEVITLILCSFMMICPIRVGFSKLHLFYSLQVLHNL